MDLKMLKGMTLEDLLKVDYTGLTEPEVAYVEQRLIKAVNKRVNRLKQTGLIAHTRLTAKEKKGLSTYKAPKGGVRTTRGGKTVRVNIRNKRIKSANKAREVLSKKTSRVSGITAQEERYKQVISDQLGKEVKLDRRRLKRVNKLMKKAEELYGLGNENKKFSGSPVVLQTIVDIVKSRKYIRNEEAEQIIQEAIDRGYKSAQNLMKEFLDIDEDNESDDIDFLTDDDMRGIF